MQHTGLCLQRTCAHDVLFSHVMLLARAAAEHARVLLHEQYFTVYYRSSCIHPAGVLDTVLYRCLHFHPLVLSAAPRRPCLFRNSCIACAFLPCPFCFQQPWPCNGAASSPSCWRPQASLLQARCKDQSRCHACVLAGCVPCCKDQYCMCSTGTP